MPTPNGIIAANAQTTGEAWLTLLELDHATFSEPIRVTDNKVGVVSNGNAYIAWPFELKLPDDDAAERPVARLRIDNVGEFDVDGEKRTIVDIIRACVGAPTVAISIVLASDHDQVEAGPMDFTLRDVRAPDELVIEGDLYLEDVLNEPFPADSFVPSQYPGLF